MVGLLCEDSTGVTRVVILLQGPYPTFPEDQGPPPEPRLFLISDKVPGGVEEVLDFSQNDLNPDDVFLLDAYYAVRAPP
jgi:hypothetical protein